MSTKPLILFYGNCNMTFLKNVFSQTPSISERYETLWIRSFLQDERVLSDMEVAIRHCAIFFEQAGSFRQDLQRRGASGSEMPLPPGCRRIRFAPLFLNTLWPFVWNDPRNAVTCTPALNEGAYPSGLCNRLIGEILREESDPDRVYQRYMAIRIRDKVDLDRFHELTLRKLRALDRDSDISFADFIESRFTTQRLFLMYLHPAGPPLRRLCEEAFRLLDVPPEETAGRLAQIEAGRGIGSYDAPIHPEIVEHFGLSWAKGLKYRHHDEGEFEHDEFIRRYIRFEYTPEYYLGLQCGQNGEHAQAVLHLRDAVLKPNAPARHFEAYGRACAKVGRADLARAAFARALALSPPQRAS